MSKMKTRYLRLTEEKNALDYLEKAYHYIHEVKKNTLAWKWAILTLHGALYGFAICALKGTSPPRVIDQRKIYENLENLPIGIKKGGFPKSINKIKYDELKKHLSFKGIMSKDEKEELISLSNDIKYKKAIEELFNKSNNRNLISFNEAIKRCQDPNYMRMTYQSKPLQLTDQQNDSIKRLKEDFRDNFEHFKPMGLSIEVSGMPQIAINILNVIRFLALDSGNYVNLTTSQQRKIKSIAYQSKQILKRLGKGGDKS